MSLCSRCSIRHASLGDIGLCISYGRGCINPISKYPQCYYLILSQNMCLTDIRQPQWRRDGVCRPGQTSVLPPPPIRSVLRSGYLSGFRTWVCEPSLSVPYSFPSHSLPSPLSHSYTPISHPFPSTPLEVAPWI